MAKVEPFCSVNEAKKPASERVHHERDPVRTRSRHTEARAQIGNGRLSALQGLSPVLDARP
jgi:hypothetical protein